MEDEISEKEFRDTGYTKNAINFPLSDAAFKRKCIFNGAVPEQAPRTWRYAPNAICQREWEQMTDEELTGILMKRSTSSFRRDQD